MAEVEEEFDSWLTGKGGEAPVAAADAGGTSWWPKSVPSLPTSIALPSDPSELGSMLWDAAARVKASVAESIDGNLVEFQLEHERALAEARRLEPVAAAAGGGGGGSDALAPWSVLAEQYQILEEDLRASMLELSKSQSTFLEHAHRSPAAGPPFDYARMLPTCLAALREDPNLRQRRFELVPKRVDEVSFWRNYFEKVAAIKDAILATSVHLNSIDGPAHAARATQRRTAAPISAQASAAAAADGRADEMAERIRRELSLLADEPPLAPVAPPVVAQQPPPHTAPSPVVAAPAPPPLPSPAVQPPPQPREASAPPAAVEPSHAAAATAPVDLGADEDSGLSDCDGDDDGIDLNSDDDIDKLLALDDDDNE